MLLAKLFNLFLPGYLEIHWFSTVENHGYLRHDVGLDRNTKPNHYNVNKYLNFIQRLDISVTNCAERYDSPIAACEITLNTGCIFTMVYSPHPVVPLFNNSNYSSDGPDTADDVNE